MPRSSRITRACSHGSRRAEAGRQVALRAIARIDRDWTTLPDVGGPAGFCLDDHPYARDLDLFGHASLASWLGRAATPTGEYRLFGWLLAADQPDDVAIRQQAVDDLASRAEWRETLAIEGLLGRAGEAELARFLAWAETGAPAIPWFTYRIALVTTAAIWLLIVSQLLGVTDREWWLLPLTTGIVMSFILARRMYAVFDQASMGQRVLERYSAMLAQVCKETWSAPELLRIQAEMRDRGGDAPHLVTRLSRLVEWSELRTAAALLHFPIQALTLWDFHVLFAIERWRDAHGRHVRRWLDALGRVDALSILAALRHDYPEWTFARIDPSARRFVATGLGHPLIPDSRRVSNDVDVGPAGTLLLITGSNMSGKSTLLRAIGVNAVLAQAGAPACATSLQMPSLRRVEQHQNSGLARAWSVLLHGRTGTVEGDRGRGRSADTVCCTCSTRCCRAPTAPSARMAVRAIARHLLDAGAIGVMTSTTSRWRRRSPSPRPRGSSTLPSRYTPTGA